ncbi:MAG TPA: adenosine deaminase [Acidimicrobiales bacterium]|nr:adenosine deaminase [Acidimicrobiales bacterium]
MTSATAAHVRALPKVELHCHVEGSARPSTIAALARRNGVDIGRRDPAELFRFTDLNQFLSVYDIVCRSLVTADDFHRIAYEALEDGARAGVRYREMFFSPGFVLKLGVPIETVWAGLSAGVEDATNDFPIRCRMILDVDKPSGPAHAMEMVSFAAAQDRDRLVGVGGDSTERGIDHRVFGPAFAEAAGRGLRRTMHAGEDGPADNIRIAVEELGCERIDHGFRLLDDPELTALVASRRIPLTVCPISNKVIANVIGDVAEHPIARQRALGVLVTVNSDDPGMMGTDVRDDYEAVWRAFGWDLEAMEQLGFDAIDASWAPPDEKAALRASFAEEHARLRREHGAA